jgi:hypothetical protein
VLLVVPGESILFRTRVLARSILQKIPDNDIRVWKRFLIGLLPNL